MGEHIELSYLYNNIEIRKRADRSIAHGSLTNSKRPSCFVKGIYPTHFKKGYGSTLLDVDDHTYLDFIGGLGTNLFGYANPDIARAVNQVLMQGGAVFSMGSDLEVECAEKLKGMFPFIDRLRFLKTGSEGCAAAVRIARAFTGKKLVLSEGYHGWSDQFISLTEPANGVSDYHYIDTFKLTDEIFDRAAAVIIEPVIIDLSADRIKELQKLREECSKCGTILIFDETITTYRFPNYCVARHLNILPDLWIGGKAIAGGLPLSVVGGRKDIMESDYFVSSTWGGDRTALAAAMVAADLVHNDFKPEDLWVDGTHFMEKFNAITSEVQLVGYPTRGIIKYKDDGFKALFMQEMCLAGVLIGPSWFYSKFLHREMDNVIAIARGVVKRIIHGMVALRGSLPESPFAEKVRRS